ncbi:MAG: response regulator [Marinilabiliaceae bacterium]|nr:response regulator [Marinilabiliaceae bacterium]
MRFLNRLISLFIFEQDEKLELEEKNRILLANLFNFILFLIVFIEGVFSLLNEEILYAGPLLILSLFFLINYLFLARKPQEFKYREVLLIVAFLTFSFFIIFGGNTNLGILWTLLFPYFSIPIYGKRNGILYSLLLMGIILSHFFFLTTIIPFSKNNNIETTTILISLYSVSIFISYTLHFISTEVIMNKEKIMLDSQNINKTQEEHISQLSHQIRTPLSNITGIIDILERTELTDDQRDYINTIHASANNLVNVVNSLVSASKPNINQIPEETINFNLYAIINNTLRLFQDKQNNKRFSLSLSADIPTHVIGSSIKIKQILLNVFNSIIKQNKDEATTISIDVTRKETMPGKIDLLFKITSNHPLPLSREHASRESLYNQDIIRLNTSKYVNLLDLNITQRLIEADGNTLSIIPGTDSTTFEFTLSFKESNKSQSILNIQEKTKRTTEGTFKHKVDIKNANVLLVEDNFSNQQIIILYIKNEVNKIEVAFNGKEALDKFGKAKYDLILMDVQMPIMDGFKATQKIREIERSTNTHTPIIAVTANAFPEDKEKCIASGMDDYISKPFQPEDLITKIKQHLS